MILIKIGGVVVALYFLYKIFFSRKKEWIPCEDELGNKCFVLKEVRFTRDPDDIGEFSGEPYYREETYYRWSPFENFVNRDRTPVTESQWMRMRNGEIPCEIIERGHKNVFESWQFEN